MRMRIASVAIVICLTVGLSLAALVAPPLAAPAKADPMQTLTLTVNATFPTLVANGRAHNLQEGDKVIQFTRANWDVGSNPSGDVMTVSSVAVPVSGDLAGTMSAEGQLVTVSWDGMPGTGYAIQNISFDDGQGNTFAGLIVQDIDMIANGFNTTGRVLSTSGTGTFSGNVLVGTETSTLTVSGDTVTQTSTMILRRYSASEASGPDAFTGTGASTVGNGRVMDSSIGPLPDDELLQFTGSNLLVSPTAACTYAEGITSSGTTSGALTGTLTTEMNSVNLPDGSPALQGWSVGKLVYSDGAGTMNGVVVADELGLGQQSAIIFMSAETGATGAYAGKEHYATVTTQGSPPGPLIPYSFDANLYTLTPGAGPTPTPAPTPAPSPAPVETITLTVNATFPTLVANGRAHNLQEGDEVIQFTRDNLIVGSNPSGDVMTVSSVAVPVSGDLIGTMSAEGQLVTVSWDGMPGTGYAIQNISFDDGQGNTFAGLVVQDIDMIANGFNTTGRVLSTSGTGIFSGNVLVGTEASTLTVSGDTVTQTSTMILRRYSSGEVSGPEAFSMSATLTSGGASPLGPSFGPLPNDEFIQFTRSNIVIPQSDPAFYGHSENITGSCSGALTGTMPQFSNSISLTNTPPHGEGWGAAKFAYTDGSGTMNFVGVFDFLGTGQSQGYMFATTEMGVTGAYAGKEYYAIATSTEAVGGGGSPTGVLNGNLYVLAASQVNTQSGSDVPVDLGNVQVTFDGVSGAGTTTVTTQQGNPGGPLPPNFRVRGQFVDIVTTATYTGNVTVGIRYAPGTENPQNLKLFHDEGGNWVDVTTWVDTANRIVYGEVSSFSWFFIGGEWVYVAESAPVAPNVYLGIAAAFAAAILALGIRRKLVRQQ